MILETQEIVSEKETDLKMLKTTIVCSPTVFSGGHPNIVKIPFSEHLRSRHHFIESQYYFRLKKKTHMSFS